MLSHEFLERIQTGQKELESIEFNYADFKGRKFENLVFRNCKFSFVLMNYGGFRNVVFDGCEVFFTAFGYSNFTDVSFINCRIEYSGFTGAYFQSSFMKNTALSWISMIEANLGGLEFDRCTEFNVVRDIAQATPELLQKSLSELEPFLNQLDFDIRKRVTDHIAKFAKHVNLEVSRSDKSGEPPAYGKFSVSAARAYGALDDVIGRVVDYNRNKKKSADPYVSDKGPYKN